MNVTLLLQPAADRNRSMVLYGERLEANQPTGENWRLRRLTTIPTAIGFRLAEIVMPPLQMPFIDGDVVHILDHAHSGYLRFTGKPSVVTVHDLIPLRWLAGEYPVRDRMSRRAAFWFKWNIECLRRARRVVAPSAATAGVLKRLMGLHATVVPHGIDRVFFEPPNPSIAAGVYGKLDGDPAATLLQVSTGPFYKNELAFAEVFVRLANHFPKLRWLRVGAPLSPRLLEQLGPLRERVIEYGAVNVLELVALYHQATCLLFPSWDEGFGWPPLEAMAAGCPVVCSNAGALTEVAGAAALTAAPDDIAGLAKHVADVLANQSLRAELRERGRAHAATYTWQRAAAAMQQVYQEAAR